MSAKKTTRSSLAPKRHQRDALVAVTREILALKGKVARNLFEIGTRLLRTQEQQLFLAGGFDSFEDYLERAVSLSRTTAYRTMRIAHHFNADIARDYGIEKLSAVLAYMEATPSEEQPGDIFAARIRIRNSDGRYRQLTLHKATYREIRNATQLVLADNYRRQAVPKRALAQATRLSNALPPPPAGTLRGDRIRFRRGRDGELAVSFHAIPVDELPKFLRLVKEHLSGYGG